MSKKLLTFIGMSTLVASSAFANTSANISKTKVEKSQSNLEKEESLKGDFGFTSNQLVEGVGDVVGNQYFGELNLDYKNVNQLDTVKVFKMATRTNNEEQLMLSIPEAYTDFEFSSSSRISMGRKVLAWSMVDEEWGLGRVNNRINFDFLNPGQEGLTGFTYSKTTKSGFGIDLFGSFTNIPELNPGFKIDSNAGTVECQNPWCKAPDATAPVEDEDKPIFYNVNYPEVADVVLKQSYGLNARFNKTFDLVDKEKRSALEKKGEKVEPNNLELGMNLFWFKKPENNISISAEVRYEIEEDRIFVDATPEVYYHDVTGGNIELNFSKYNTKLYGSAISINPNTSPDGDQNKVFEYTGIKPKKKKEDYLSGGIAFDNGNLKLRSGYIARVSDFDRENDILVEYPRWNQAIHLAVSHKVTGKLLVSLDYKYDMLTEDRITMLNSSYRFASNIIGSVGANIIGTSPEKESFWSDYENNDAVYSSVKYTF